MVGLRGLEGGKLVTQSDTIASGTTTAEFDLSGGTLVAVVLEADITSTSFTITTSPTSGGTFTTLKDPLGTYATAGTDISFTLPATATGTYIIPKDITYGVRYMKIVFGSSETNATVSIKYRSIE